MISSRQQFLRTLFRRLEDKSIPYCVQRNYSGIYENNLSDIDLLVGPADLRVLKRELDRTAAATEHRLVLSARFVNLSRVYLGPGGEFIRIDVDTEVRWRIFPILSAQAILRRRRRREDFYVPHPVDESVILFTAAAWRGNLSERYRQRLAELCGEFNDAQEHNRKLHEAFGAAGERIALAQCQLHSQPLHPKFWRDVKRSILLNSVSRVPQAAAACKFLCSDVARFLRRMIRPPGMSITHVSANKSSKLADEIFERLKLVFPADKSMNLLRGPSRQTRLGLGRLPWRRFWTLFRGGAWFESCQAPEDGLLPGLLRRSVPRLYASRVFLCVETLNGSIYLADGETGYMAEIGASSAASTDRIFKFFCSGLERRSQESTAPPNRGVFAVLVGLDGSGKTTVARELCALAEAQQRFKKIRYFHWQPRVGAKPVFPFPEFRNLPRKTPLQPGTAQSALSVLRLLKNLLLARVTHWLTVGPLLRKNTLVLVDRYFYNYYLDPVSLRYYGPRSLLDRAAARFPKPDLLVVLKASAEILLLRKQELPRDEVLKQTALLEKTSFAARVKLELDAARPPEELARAIAKALQSLST